MLYSLRFTREKKSKVLEARWRDELEEWGGSSEVEVRQERRRKRKEGKWVIKG